MLHTYTIEQFAGMGVWNEVAFGDDKHAADRLLRQLQTLNPDRKYRIKVTRTAAF
jgi:hypothetical protein